MWEGVTRGAGKGVTRGMDASEVWHDQTCLRAQPKSLRTEVCLCCYFLNRLKGHHVSTKYAKLYQPFCQLLLRLRGPFFATGLFVIKMPSSLSDDSIFSDVQSSLYLLTNLNLRTSAKQPDLTFISLFIGWISSVLVLNNINQFMKQLLESLINGWADLSVSCAK